jgi:hypothetical protein
MGDCGGNTFMSLEFGPVLTVLTPADECLGHYANFVELRNSQHFELKIV